MEPNNTLFLQENMDCLVQEQGWEESSEATFYSLVGQKKEKS